MADDENHIGEEPTRRGGWNTTPFILATMAGLTVSAGGLLSNLIVYLIKEFNIKSIDAAQINNVIAGCVNFFPLMAAIFADSFLGCFSVIWISSLFSLLGLVLILLTSTIAALKPSACKNGSLCTSPSALQYTVLYTALALISIGRGGTTFTLATMGANQFTKPSSQATYFNWYFVTLYVSSVISSTAIVYIEDNISWPWGFGICIIANVLGLAVFVLGRRYYYLDKPKGSPFTSIARVFVASFRKRKEVVSLKSEDYYYGDGGGNMAEAPTKSFRLLNRAALNTEQVTISPNGSISKPWKLCTVQQVEDLKTLIRILPLWSSSILLGTPIGIQASLSILQALSMDRHVSSRHFQIPAGSILVFTLISTVICLSLFDRFLWPLWAKVANKNRTPLQQIGIGHVFNVASMAVSALVEAKRRGANDQNPISVLWLVPQLVIVGIGEAFHFPGQVGLYYQEFPGCLKSMATAMVGMLIGIAFYMSTVVIDFVRKVTKWLPDDINDGRLDNVYWVLVVLGIVNFGYYLVCAWFYEYKDVEIGEGDDDEGDHNSGK